MEIVVQEKSVYFCGKVKDILKMLSDYPPDTTLKEYIRLHLN
jgi:hypothetical protein